MTSGNVFGDRRRLSTSEMVSIMMLLLQFAALIWGASALKSSVDQVRLTMTSLTATVREMQTTTTTLSVDVGILKERSVKR